MTRCEQCGFVYEDLSSRDVPAALRSSAARCSAVLADQLPTALTRRPAPATWSALEYACHVRDVMLVQRERVLQALVEDRPRFVPMHREERVALARYAEESPEEVREELTVAANLLAKVFEGLSGAQMSRRCFYNFPEPVEQDLAWVGRHTVHEAQHHLEDIEAQLT